MNNEHITKDIIENQKNILEDYINLIDWEKASEKSLSIDFIKYNKEYLNMNKVLKNNIFTSYEILELVKILENFEDFQFLFEYQDINFYIINCMENKIDIISKNLFNSSIDYKYPRQFYIDFCFLDLILKNCTINDDFLFYIHDNKYYRTLDDSNNIHEDPFLSIKDFSNISLKAINSIPRVKIACMKSPYFNKTFNTDIPLDYLIENIELFNLTLSDLFNRGKIETIDKLFYYVEIMIKRSLEVIITEWNRDLTLLMNKKIIMILDNGKKIRGYNEIYNRYFSKLKDINFELFCIMEDINNNIDGELLYIGEEKKKY